jgi:hypothetical protein
MSVFIRGIVKMDGRPRLAGPFVARQGIATAQATVADTGAAWTLEGAVTLQPELAALNPAKGSFHSGEGT